MRRARNQTVPTRSAFPATPRNSPPRKLFHCVASASESPAPASIFACRCRLKSAPSSPWVPRGRPSRRHGASPPRVQSSGQIVLRSSNAAAAHHFPFQEWPASADSPRAAATLPVRILSPSSPPRQAATLRPRSSPCPAPKPSAPALRFPARASTSRMTNRPGPAAPRPAAPDPVAREEAPLAPPRPIPLPQSGTWPPALFAARISPLVRHPRSKWPSSRFFSKRKPHHEPRPSPIFHRALEFELAAPIRCSTGHNRQPQARPLTFWREKGLHYFPAHPRRTSPPTPSHRHHPL